MTTRCILATFLLVATAICTMKPCSAQEGITWGYADGGIVDVNSGLVWAPETLKRLTGSWATWNWAADQAGLYSVEQDGIVYADWRLATVAEIQDVVADNPTLIEHVTDGHVNFWTNDARGASAYLVTLDVQPNYDQDGILTGYTVLGVESVDLIKKNSFATDALLVRPEGTGTKGGRK